MVTLKVHKQKYIQIKCQIVNPNSQSRLRGRTLGGLLVRHVRLIEGINWAKMWQRKLREKMVVNRG